MSEKMTSPTTSLLKRAPWALVIGEEPLNSGYAKMAVFASKLRNVNFVGNYRDRCNNPQVPSPQHIRFTQGRRRRGASTREDFQEVILKRKRPVRPQTS